MKKKITTPIILLLLTVFIAILCKIYIFGYVTDIDQIYFTKIEISPYSLSLHGGTSNSATAYSSHEIRIKDGVGYIELRYSLVSIFHKDGNFTIDEGVLLENVDKLFLVDSTGGEKMIWSKSK